MINSEKICQCGHLNIEHHCYKPKRYTRLSNYTYCYMDDCTCSEFMEQNFDKKINNSAHDLVDTGDREVYDSGMVREPKAGHGRYDLLSSEAIRRIAIVYEKGSQKYSERNWEKGGKWSKCLCSALRHIFKWMEGRSDEDHLAMACWNLMAIMHFEKHYKQGNDLPARKNTKKDYSQSL